MSEINDEIGLQDKLPKVVYMVKSFWKHNRSLNVLDTLRNAPLLARSYSQYHYTVPMRDVHLIKMLLQMLFVLPFNPKTVAKLSDMYAKEIGHTFLPLFMKLYSRIPYDLIMDIRNHLPPNPSYDDMITFLNTPHSQAIVITNLTNYNIKRLMKNYSAQEVKDLYFLLKDFDCTLDGSF
jgi:hypothetical protein